MTKRSVLGAVTKQLSVRDERRLGAVDHDLMVFGSLPRRCDRRSQICRQRSALDEFLPRVSHFSLVHPGSCDVTKSATCLTKARDQSLRRLLVESAGAVAQKLWIQSLPAALTA